MLLASCEQETGLFDFRRSDGTFQLLVIDRMDDPVTPLLSQWTYQVRDGALLLLLPLLRAFHPSTPRWIHVLI